jgi:hypothetical protein
MRRLNVSAAAEMRVSLGKWSTYLARLRPLTTRVAYSLSTADSAAARKGSATVMSIGKRGSPSGSAKYVDQLNQFALSITIP